MKTALKLLIRVIKRKMECGEDLEQILKEYPRLTTEEREQVLAALGVSK